MVVICVEEVSDRLPQVEKPVSLLSLRHANFDILDDIFELNLVLLHCLDHRVG